MISFIGNVKNAGKTTVLNSVVKSYNHSVIITSIGLDGENIDQVTLMEKPQIYVRENDIVATAKDTLKQFEAEYQMIEETNIFTAIGNIVICKIIKPGKVLVAGPSLVTDMSLLIDVLKEKYDHKILIDGAFFRQSFASVSETCILVIGSNISIDMDYTVEQASLIYKKLTLPSIPTEYKWVKNEKNISMIKTDKKYILDSDSVIGHVDQILNKSNHDLKMLYLPKSLTDEFVEKWIHQIKYFHFDLILKSGINIQLSDQNLKNLFRLKTHIYVENPIDVSIVCINPFSPRGYEYDQSTFKEKLSLAINRKVINVKEGEHNEQT
ncbi:hypothetical protein KHQ88_00250 [Mycoplasmatota bacterium]|nr:hypothetical protein KHQ88_00250 [Mycoplasmatota bacterium]